MPNKSKTAEEKPYQRKVSIPERGWVVIGDVFPPFSNQMILEGSGDLDIDCWKAAVQETTLVTPGSRLVLRGWLWTSRWVDSGNAPGFREVDGSTWSGYSNEGAPFLEEKFQLDTGPTCEVVIIHGDPLRIAFRSHHAVMDGSGTITWARDIFRVLRGEKPIGSHSNLSDRDIVQSEQKKYLKADHHGHIVPAGRAEGTSFGVSWGRRTIVGSYKNLVPQVAALMAREARRDADGRVRFVIPVDLRRHKPELHSTANLTGAIYAEIEKDASTDEIADSIKQQINTFSELLIDRRGIKVPYLPIWLMRKMARMMVRHVHRTGNYRISGMISNLGRLNLEEFTGGGFKPKTTFLIPPGGANPAFMVLTGSGDAVELTFALPEVLATNGRLDAILDRVADGLVAKGK
ncbi:MAG: hypothetical protein GY847_32405 [Proteobacteria bacterium]|nr:hypothetical protein [Pseudomonadota bacterium]